MYIEIDSSDEEEAPIPPDTPSRQVSELIQKASESLISPDVSEEHPIPDTSSKQQSEVIQRASESLISLGVSQQEFEVNQRASESLLSLQNAGFNQEEAAFSSEGECPSPRDLNIATDLMKKGSKAFTDHNYEEAATCFMIARDVLVKNHGKLSIECAPAYYKYGLALLCKVPISFEDDPMGLVPNEADYQSASAGKPVVKDDGIIVGDVDDLLESAWKELNVACSIVKKQPGNSMEKVNILSALGEVAYRKGELYPEFYYLEALTILKNLVEPDNPRIAHLNFKISVCLEDSSKTEAIAYCKKAISVCQIRLKRLIAEMTSSSKTAATLTIPDLNLEIPEEPDEVPSIVQKKAERSTLIKLTSDLLFKLDELEKFVP